MKNKTTLSFSSSFLSLFLSVFSALDDFLPSFLFWQLSRLLLFFFFGNTVKKIVWGGKVGEG